MTREDNIRAILESNFAGMKDEIIDNAVNGIMELEQEPATKSDLGVDAVSRDDVVRIVQHNNPIKALEKIRRLPSVTSQEPIRSKGKWISHHCGAYYECSNCHERNNSRYDKYCKFCGAKMDGVEEK